MSLILGLGGVVLVVVVWMLLRKPSSPPTTRAPSSASSPPRKPSLVPEPETQTLAGQEDAAQPFAPRELNTSVEHDGHFATRIGHGKATHEGPATFDPAPENGEGNSDEDESRPIPEALNDFELARLDTLDSHAKAQVARICDAMPAPSPITRQLATGLDTPEALKEAVVSDVGLTAAILRAVNSAAFALASPITSVQHAITYLGVMVVKGLVAQAALATDVESGTPEQSAALRRVWRSAFFASAFAQILAQELGEERPSVLATKSLFFNLGDVALLSGVEIAWEWYGEGVTLVDRIRAQQAACGGNTAIVGAELATLWNLPEDLAEAIEQGYVLLATPPEEHVMEAQALRENLIVYLAGRFGDRVAYFGLRDLADLAVEDSDDPSLFFLPAHLQSTGLERVMGVLADPAFRRKANHFISTIAA